MRKLYFSFLTFMMMASNYVQAQVTFSNVSQVYTQDFDGLANTGTNNAFDLTGWSANRTTYNAGTGSNNAGSMYSFGAASSTERSLGTLTSGSVPTIAFGFKLINSTGENVRSVNVSYTGEQWRRGTRRVFDTNQPVPDTLYFEYSLDADSINDSLATWVRLSELSFSSPDTTGQDVAKDGDNAALQKAFNNTFAVDVNNGQSVWIRWISPRYSNNTPGGIVGSKDGLAVDNLSVRVQTSTNTFDKASFSALNVFPNPVKGNVVNVSFSELKTATGEFALYGMDGRMIWAKRLTLSQQMSVELPAGIPMGMYNLVMTEDGNASSARILIAE